MKKAKNAIPNELLAFEREQRQWTQEEVAERIELPDAKTLGRWERGITSPSSFYRQKLVTLFGKSARELGFVPGHEIPFWSVPYARNGFFSGREATLAAIQRILLHTRETEAALPLALTGLGGVGKTQSALEYAYRQRRDYHTVAWIRAQSRDDLLSDLVALARLLNLPQQKEQDHAVILAAVKGWLAALTRWLLIFDNLEDLGLLDEFLPSPFRGHILLTTRVQATGTRAQALAIETMTPDEGTSLLLRRAKLIAPHGEALDTSTEEYQRAREISEMMGGLPLALDQAGAYIEETACGLEEYLARYRQQKEVFLQRRGSLDEHEPVATTWSLSFEKVARTNAGASALLNFLAFLAPDAVPIEILARGGAALEEPLATVAAQPSLLDEAIRDLRRYSLIQRSPATNSLSLHRLVQVSLLHMMTREEQRRRAVSTVHALSAVFPSGEFETWQQCERLLPQALMAVELARQWNIVSLEAARLTRRVANYVRNRSRVTQAAALFQQALALLEDAPGATLEEVAACLVEMGTLYLNFIAFDEAIALFQRALALYKQGVGDMHPGMAECLSGLGECYLHLENYALAEDYFRRALTIRQRVFGPQHQLVAESLSNLAMVLVRGQGKYTEAELLFQLNLDILKKQLGPDRPEVGVGLLNLAGVYRDQGKFAQAEPLFLQTIALWQRTQGSEEPDVAYALKQLAKLYAMQGNGEQAEAAYLQALAIYEKSLGPEHRASQGVRRELEALQG